MNTLLDFFDWGAFITGLVGGILGLIEIYYPKLANKLEDNIDKHQNIYQNIADKYTRKKTYNILLYFYIPAFIIMIYIPISYFSPVVPYLTLPIYLWIIISIITLHISYGLLLYFLAWLIDFLNKITNGHAIGGIGVMIIIIGTLLDLADKIISIIIKK